MKAILTSAALTEPERLALAALADGPLSAEGLRDRLGLAHYVRSNKLIGSAGHKVFDAAPRDSKIQLWRREGRSDRWYHIVAPGRYSTVDGRFYFELRPEIVEALIELEWHAPLHGVGIAEAIVSPKFEGAEILRLVSARERDPALREQCLRLKGFRCLVCGLDMGEKYGKLGSGLIHVHHLTPLSDGTGRRKTDPSTDLIPVCPNCHSVIHRGGRLLSPEEVRAALNR